MLIHFRYEGHSRRTICGQRFLPGHRPRLLGRGWSVDEPARSNTPEEIESKSGVPCAECLREAASAIKLAQNRAKVDHRSQRRFDRPRFHEDDVPDEVSNREFISEVES